MKQIEDHKMEFTNAKRLYSDPSASKMKRSRLRDSDATRQQQIMLALWKRLREYLGQSWVREYGDVNGEAFHPGCGRWVNLPRSK